VVTLTPNLSTREREIRATTIRAPLPREKEASGASG
jgi:hypothetical protein